MKLGIFGGIQVARPPVSKFDLSHAEVTTMAMGKLYPVYIQEVVPGDRFRVRPEVMVRLQPTLAPVMSRLDVTIRYYYVPYRIIWDEFEDFRTGGRLGDSAPVVPFGTINTTNATASRFAKNSLWDHMGLPVVAPGTTVTQPVNVNMLNFRAYQQTWNDYIRDENVSAPVPFSKGSGDMNSEMALLTGLRLVGYEKDYFTSALPFAQRGPQTSMPVEGGADVTNLKINDWEKAIGGANPDAGDAKFSSSNLTDTTGNVVIGKSLDGTIPLTDASFLITTFRRAAALQLWLERNARGGGRYVEYLKSHFDVTSSDARLQRAEYLGGIKKPIVMSEVLSTVADSVTGVPQGNMAGHGIAIGGNKAFERFFEEDGVVIGVAHISPRTMYFQGIPKMYSRFDKLDYYNPEFANIGEQEVKVGEIWYDAEAAPGEVDETFGYQSRNCEYKYTPSRVTGSMRGDFSFWHFGRIFGEKPLLNADFIDVDPIDRVFAALNDEDNQYIVQLYHDVSALRKMPYYDVPRIG